MCNHDTIGFTSKDGFFTGALCSECEKKWGVGDIKEALRMAEVLLDFVRTIQGSYKGSMGGIRDTYLPQLRVKRVDEIAHRLKALIFTQPPG